MHWPSILLGLAICALWLPHLHLGRRAVPVWSLLLPAAVVAGLADGTLTALALPALAALAAAAWGSTRSSHPAARVTLTVLAAALALALALHLAPGFRNPKLVDAVRLSPDTAPFTQYLNFDKASAGLLLMAAYGRRTTTVAELKRWLPAALAVAIGTAVVVIGAALAIGYVQPDVKFPRWTLAFLATNLLFTCVAEEAFFRGLVQERCAQALQHRASHVRLWVPVLVSALLFGLVHAPGGTVFVALTTLAGLGYALAYALTQRTEASITVHFLLNALQFVGFSYPYLVR